MNIYAMYRGDEFLDLGTAEELSKKYGISAKRVRNYSYPSHHRYADGHPNRVLTIKIEEDEE